MTTQLWLHRQWASRPDDERFETVALAQGAARARRAVSREIVLRTPEVAVGFAPGQAATPGDPGEVLVDLGGTGMTRLSYRAFGQLAERAKAPAGYLRELPAQLAALNLGWRLREPDLGDVQVLVQGPPGEPGSIIRSLTSDQYVRVWDAEITDVLAELVERTNGAWCVPPAGEISQDPKRASTLYMGDESSCFFLCNPSLRRVVGGEDLMPCIAWRNSEVGAAMLRVLMFDVARVCGNRMLHGVANQEIVELRHVGNIRGKLVREILPRMAEWAYRGTKDRDARVLLLQRSRYAATADAAEAWLRERSFTQTAVRHAFAYAEGRGFDPLSRWGAAAGLTDYSHTAYRQMGDRVAFEQQVARALTLAK